MAPTTPADAEAVVRAEFERLEAEARRQPGVADFLEVFEKHDAVLQQANAYLAAGEIPPIYSTTDRS